MFVLSEFADFHRFTRFVKINLKKKINLKSISSRNIIYICIPVFSIIDTQFCLYSPQIYNAVVKFLINWYIHIYKF